MAKKKKVESIWTKDITPGVVAFMNTDITPGVVSFMNTDITPNFDNPIWTKDITHIAVGSLAVFGLVVSSLVTTLGIAAVGVNIEVAFAQQEAANQTAALAFAENVHPATTSMMQNASDTPPQRPMDEHMGSNTLVVASGTPMFCPKIARTIGRGSHEATTTGDVGQLQQFIANHFGLNPGDVVTGHFGSTTQAYLQKFQEEQGIPPAPTAGPLTRAAIARVCNDNGGAMNGNGADHRGDMRSGSSTVGNTPPPMPPRRDDMRNGSSTMGTPPMPPRRDDSHPGINGSTTTPGGSNTPRPTSINASSTGVTVQIVSPNGGENYSAGSGDTLTVSWVATGVPQGAKACVALLSSDKKRLAFPHVQESCVSVSNGNGSVSGPLIVSRDYPLAPGSYLAQVSIIGPDGTAGGLLAQDSSDGVFTLDDAALGVSNTNASNSASLVEAVNEIGDGYTKLIHATLTILGL